MIRARVGILFAVLGTLAIWGCARGPASEKPLTERLQEKIQSLTALRDQLRQDLDSATNELAKLQQDINQLRDTLKERDNLLAVRTAERDAGIAQVDQIRKGLRTLVEQMDAAGPIIRDPVSAKDSKPAGQS